MPRHTLSGALECAAAEINNSTSTEEAEMMNISDPLSAADVANAANAEAENHLSSALAALSVSVSNTNSQPPSAPATPGARQNGSSFTTPLHSPSGHLNSATSSAAASPHTPVACSICLSPIVKRRNWSGSRGKGKGATFRTKCCNQLFHKDCLARHKAQACSSPSSGRACPLCRSTEHTGLTPSNRPQARVPLAGMSGTNGGFVSSWALHGEMVRRASAARQAVQRSLATTRRTVSGEMIVNAVPGLASFSNSGRRGSEDAAAGGAGGGGGGGGGAVFASPAVGASPSFTSPGAAYQSMIAGAAPPAAAGADSQRLQEVAAPLPSAAVQWSTPPPPPQPLVAPTAAAAAALAPVPQPLFEGQVVMVDSEQRPTQQQQQGPTERDMTVGLA